MEILTREEVDILRLIAAGNPIVSRENNVFEVVADEGNRFPVSRRWLFWLRVQGFIYWHYGVVAKLTEKGIAFLKQEKGL